MKQAIASYAYNVVQSGDDHIITYKKSKFGIKMYFALLWPGIILAAFLAYYSAANLNNTYAPTEKLTTGIFYWISFSLLIPVVVIFLLNLLRRPGTFTISKQGIKLNGTLYSYTDVKSVYVKSPDGDTTVTLISNRQGLMEGATQLSAESGRRIVRNFKQNNYRICFLFGKHEKIVASQLNDNMATQLLRKIDELA